MYCDGRGVKIASVTRGTHLEGILPISKNSLVQNAASIKLLSPMTLYPHKKRIVFFAVQNSSIGDLLILEHNTSHWSELIVRNKTFETILDNIGQF